MQTDNVKMLVSTAFLDLIGSREPLLNKKQRMLAQLVQLERLVW